MQNLPLQEVSLSPVGAVGGPRGASIRTIWIRPDAVAAPGRRVAGSTGCFVDAPAVDLAPDARLLARLSRAVLFVIASGATPYPAVERAMSEIGRGCIIGAVLNQVPAGRRRQCVGARRDRSHLRPSAATGQQRVGP